jgi:hypothetical protein
MKITEILLATGALLLTMTTAIAAAPPRFVIRDANGVTVGPIVPEPPALSARFGDVNESLLWVVQAVGGTPVKVLVGENGPWDTKDLEPLLFESADCTGPALMDMPAHGGDARDAVVFETDVFWPDGGGTDRLIQSQALLVRDAADCDATLAGPDLCCSPLARGETRHTAPVTSATLASLRLSPPFHVEGPDDGRN